MKMTKKPRKLYTAAEMLQMHAASTFNATDAIGVRPSKLCGCYTCGATFRSNILKVDYHTTEEDDGRRTLLCPFCGKDTVLVDNQPDIIVSKNSLSQMHAAWFDNECEGFDATCSFHRAPAVLKRMYY